MAVNCVGIVFVYMVSEGSLELGGWLWWPIVVLVFVVWSAPCGKIR